MLKYALAYGATALTFLALDYVWLAHLARRFFVDRIGHLLADKPNFGAAAGFYLVYVVGIIVFAVAPALRSGSPLAAAGMGALFGFFAYATYEMTNYATLRNWPASMVAVDVAWGTVLTGIAALAGFHAAAIFAR